jgi:hypothetical protein
LLCRWAKLVNCNLHIFAYETWHIFVLLCICWATRRERWHFWTQSYYVHTVEFATRYSASIVGSSLERLFKDRWKHFFIPTA